MGSGLATSITIQTSPSGLQFSVDGGPSQTAPQTLDLSQGSHTIAVASPQAGGSGTQYVFTSWSDGGAASHSITVGTSPATYTASFNTQYQLTTMASPPAGGTLTPPSGGYYDSGSVVFITNTPNSGYTFTSWSGNIGSPTSTSCTVTMTGPQTVTANFTQTATPITILTSPEGLLFSVDNGTQQMAPQTLSLSQGPHTIAVATTQPGGTGTQYVFTGWSDGGAVSHTITVGTTPATYTASFKTQYQLTTSASPGAGGTVTPVSGLFYDSGTVVPITATPSSGYSFTNWSGNVASPSSASTTVTMSAPQTVMANFVSTSGITVATSPPGLQIVVDAGPPVMAPQTYNWAAGSSHTIGVNSPQAGAAGTRYAYTSWSDGGGQTHSITVPNSPTTYTASFTTQYLLTTSASPGAGGTVTPVSGSFYGSGTVVPISATANSGYSFTNWSGNVAAPTSASTTVTMSAPQTVTANFSSTSGITIAASPPGLQIVVDAGTPVMAPQTYNWAAGSSHTIGVNSPQAGAAGTRYAYASWSDGGAQTHSITVPNSQATYTASFATQYQLTTSASPGVGGTVTPVSGLFYDSGTVVPITAAPSSGYSFTNWSGNVASPSSASTTVTMSAPQTVMANFVSTSGITVATSPPGLQIVVDAGAPVMAPQTYNWAAGSSHTIGVNSPQAGAAGTRYVYASWSDGGGQTHTVTAPNSPTTYTASFATQYLLTTSASPGAGGTVTPVSGLFYGSGTVVPISATANSGYSFTNWSGNVAAPTSASTTVTMSAPQTVTANFVSTSGITVTTSPPGLQIVVDAGAPVMAPQTYNWAAGSSHSIGVNSPQPGASGTRYVYASWSDGGGQTHTVTAPNSPTTYTASFNTQYLLTTAVSPAGAGTVTPNPTSPDGYYNSGTSVGLTAAPSSQFLNWSGDLSGSANPQSIVMNAPHSVNANFGSGVTVIILPFSPSLNAGQCVQIPVSVTGTTNMVVNWSINPNVGTISTTGQYCAPASVNSSQTVTVTATSAADPTKSDKTTITLIPVSVSVSPLKVTLTAGLTQQFSAAIAGSSNTAVNWSINPSVGTISTTGLYTAPSSISTPQLVTVTATSAADPTKSSSATVALSATVAVSVGPANVTLTAKQTQQFSASVTGSGNMAVTWSVNPSVGTISTSGLYTAPSVVSAQQSVTVTAISQADPTKSASTALTLVGPPSIVPPTLPTGVVGAVYQTVKLEAQGGLPPYTWSSAAGTPDGLSLGADGTLAGTPTTAGPFTLSVTVTDNGGIPGAQATLPIAINKPALSASPNTLNFTYQQGSPTPSAQTISLFSSTGAPIKFTVSGSSAAWLVPSAQSGQTPATVSVKLQNLGTLAPATYSGQVTFDASGSGNPTVVAVTLVVQPLPPKPSLSLSPGDFTLALAQNGSPVKRDVVVANAGTGNLVYQATATSQASAASCPWMTLSNASNTVAAGSSQAIGATITPGTLQPGTYFCTISVQGQTPDLTGQVNVTLQVNSLPNIVVSQTGLRFTATQNGADPPGQTVTVINGGSIVLNWTASPGCDWLTATTSATSLQGGGVGQLTLAASTRNLAEGSFFCTVQVTAPNAANSPQLVTAQFNVVKAGQSLPAQVSPTGVILTAQSGGTDPAPVAISVSNLNASALSYTTTVTTDVMLTGGGPWFTAPASGTVTGTASISIQAKLSQLPVGAHHGILSIGFSDGNTHTVQVLAVVTANATSTQASQAAQQKAVTPLAGDPPICTPPQNVPEITVTFQSPEQNFTVTSPGPQLLRVSAINACGTPVNDGPVWVDFSTPQSTPADPRLDLHWVSDGIWEGSWTPTTAESVRLRARASNQTLANTLLGVSDFFYGTVLAAPATAPPVAGGITSAAALQIHGNQVALGGWISIYGQRLASGAVSSPTVPFLTKLGETTVLLGNVDLPLSFVAPTQVNALVPLTEVTTNTNLSLLVTNGQAQATPLSLTTVDYQPAIFTQNGTGIGPGAIQDANYQTVKTGNPVKVGDYILIYCTGLGPLDNAPPENSPAPGNPPATTHATPTVIFGDGSNSVSVTGADISFSGLSPGSIALYQVNVKVPQGVQSGDAISVRLSIGDLTSNTVTIAVK
jgi:uncharacterized protein (TIGR03437 family)